MKRKEQAGYRDDERLRTRYQGVLFSSALRENRCDEVHHLCEPSEEDARYAALLAKGRDARLRRLMRRLFFRKLWERLKGGAPRALRTAAAACAALCIGLTTAFASSESFRVTVYTMFAQDYGEYTAISMKEAPEAAFDVPEEWGGDYYPSYIPEGFEMTDIQNAFDYMFWVEYRNADNIRLGFDDDPISAQMNIDTENAHVYYTDIHGEQALVSVKPEHVIIVWSEDNRIFTVSIDGDDEETALRVARSIRQIR
ncbi:MAG: DUF4367 domain-containing protein [Clostridia bacterium]|nr:DUF4367 domain-containing protein [Clostridia bacterium]